MKVSVQQIARLGSTSLAVLSLVIFATVFTVFTAACSSSSGGGSNDNSGLSTTTLGSTQTPTQTVLDGTGGAQAPLTFISQSVLDSYVGWSTNSPDDGAIGVNLVELNSWGNGAGGTNYTFGGAVSIAFADGANTYIDTFTSNLQGQPNTINSNVTNNEYNEISTLFPGMGGQPAYHGFFQGPSYCIVGNSYSYQLSPGEPCVGTTFGGAVILVMNSMTFNADGEGAEGANGSIWFYNFTASTGAPVPGTSCWFITAGPYQCGTFFNGDHSIVSLSALNPANGYTELGVFTNLDLGEALNGQLQ